VKEMGRRSRSKRQKFVDVNVSSHTTPLCTPQPIHHRIELAAGGAEQFGGAAFVATGLFDGSLRHVFKS
jgi:hypothetical protein